MQANNKSGVSRRTFIQRTALCAAPLVMPSSVVTSGFASESRISPNDKIRLGLIGTGRQCMFHNIPGFVRQVDAQVVALCDVDSWRLEQAHRKVVDIYNQSVSLLKPASIDTYVDYNDLLSRTDIDAVVISTPDHWHAQQALDAMRAGKHVALEKPIIRTIAEGQELVRVSRETQKLFRVDSEFRSGAGAHRAAELVRNGHLGKVHRVVVAVPQSDVACPPQADMEVPSDLDYQRWLGASAPAPYTTYRVHPPRAWDRPGWMRCLSYCDGMITNWGTHLLNGALWALGLDRTGPTMIEGTGTYPPHDSFWSVLLKFESTFHYANGVEIVYKTEKPYFQIEGERGSITVTFQGITADPPAILDEVIEDGKTRFPLKSEKRDFLDSIRTNTETLEPAEVGHRVTSACLLAHIAIRTNSPIHWDPDNEVLVGVSAKNTAAQQYLTTPIVTSH